LFFLDCWGEQAFAWGVSFHWRGAAPVSARQAGDFHLLAQMKVTKAKGLKPSFVPHAPARRVLLMTDF
jgi:hypothetical protein